MYTYLSNERKFTALIVMSSKQRHNSPKIQNKRIKNKMWHGNTPTGLAKGKGKNALTDTHIAHRLTLPFDRVKKNEFGWWKAHARHDLYDRENAIVVEW